MLFLIAVVIMGVFAMIGYNMAAARNKDPMTWAILCGLTGLIGVLILAATGEAKAEIPDDPLRVRDDSASRVARPVESAAPAHTYDKAKWEVLKEVDNDISRSSAMALQLGAKYEQILAEKYLTLGDKSYLPALLTKLKEQYDAEQGAAAAIKNSSAAAEYEKFMTKVSANDGVDPDNGLRVVKAVEYNGPASSYHGGIKVVYENGRTVLRNKSMTRPFDTEAKADKWGLDLTKP
ncbi:MAG: hypothetical protein E5X23_08465 [Mesorhizobium sp.]|uniref:hypothetical protein n=1 Tax=unclassified Mesorhizobium TaxID=325217 RepID=UPI000FCC5DEA|nr:MULTISPECIES: hypothetical protein [unclassified Mesorhizobium]MCT2581123.1 hypothetical protein [Mesorhizobium sp. P13.3]MDF3170117.1 hypothetical protein [Mesorhizobium sp. P16.1]MDF3181432.1 hypothetical protein [Mesorhizobium sp. P17.1]MDF3187035.1 hypothetical protein [Mesorhizobium sp. ICCV3110.1]RUV56574.1 hypothetical protein EOA64_28245 [Mesorhizobium sp. M1A.F.Ca.IN.022.02.1.1]